MISMDKKYRTRDGREVRIYATDGYPNKVIYGAIKYYGRIWAATFWQRDGRIFSDIETEDDLIEVKPRIKRTVWLHVFRNGEVLSTSEPPDHYITTRVACVKVEIDVEEGEGL